MYNKYGEEVSALFYGAHDIQHVGDNHFTIFDNDYHNRTDVTSTYSRFVEFVIDEVNMVAREVFTYVGPSPSHFSNNRGGVDKLPFNTYLGSFCGSGLDETMRYWTEVSQDGEVIWELAINESTAFRSEVFYDKPLFDVDEESLGSIRKENTLLNLTVWNSYRSRIDTDGTIKVYDGEDLLFEEDLVFLPEWEPTELSIELPTADYKKGTYNLTLILENEDGISNTIYIDLTVEKASAAGVFLGLATLLFVATIIRKKKK